MIFIVVLLLASSPGRASSSSSRTASRSGQILSPTWQPDSTSPPTSFGLLPFIAGTVYVTGVALLISTPLSVGLALFLSEVAPQWARAIVQPALEIFVGIPSVVWGWLGITILVPFLSDTFHSDLVLSLPIVGDIFTRAGLPDRVLLAGGLAGPVDHDPADHHQRLLRRVPCGPAGAAHRLARPGHDALADHPPPSDPVRAPGVLTAVVLGMTRAAGEALAVQMVIGNSPTLPAAITQPVTTLTSQITLDMGNTVFGEPWQDALWTMSLVLLLHLDHVGRARSGHQQRRMAS
jgi:phosphate transport system permease protein